ncbi:MAG TPA: IS200/IS605 family transposase [Blastocatellia bacterium]|nr:IS200/IS605 family transposase [Blastocatellia bacterium]
MSQHSYSRCWLHMTWATLRRQPCLSKQVAAKVSDFLTDYAPGKGIYIVINYVNPEHVHSLIDLPTGLKIEEAFKLLKGASSHWINQNRIVESKFRWGRGYGAFSVSHSNVDRVARYIANQEEHHRKKTFISEYAQLMKAHGLTWSEEDFD